jgi:hypothetical protein
VAQIKKIRSFPAMSIEKKSLISTLKTTKKANVASTAPVAPEASHIVSKRQSKMVISKRQSKMVVSTENFDHQERGCRLAAFFFSPQLAPPEVLDSL